jgi:chromosome segregation ATPase
MSDEKPVPETLDTIAASIRELRQSMDSRFESVDSRFDSVDSRFDEVKVELRTDIADVRTQLRADIEAVRGDVRIVAEGLAAQTALLTRMDADHDRLTKRVENHDLRIVALEPKKSA